LIVGIVLVMFFPLAVFGFFRSRFLYRDLHSDSYPVSGSRETSREARILFFCWLIAIVCTIAVCAIDRLFVSYYSITYLAAALWQVCFRFSQWRKSTDFSSAKPEPGDRAFGNPLNFTWEQCKIPA
jgi:hypothetical protein